MRKNRLLKWITFIGGAVGGLLIGLASIWAEEGFWLFSAIPKGEIEKTFGFELSDQFLTHLQHSVVRLDQGATGSFVSANGLVMTNYHCVFGALSQLDSSENRYLIDGFYAKTLSEEVQCPDFELAILDHFEDVTNRIVHAEDQDLPPEEERDVQRQRTEELEKAESARTSLDCQTVKFFDGAKVFLYYYKRFNDVRLVFAPEKNVGFFGGDADNFEYPRYNFDVAFLRVYEDGKPYRPADYLKWSHKPATNGTPVLTVGNPGRSNRFKTMAHLEFFRDNDLPDLLHRLRRKETLLKRLIALGGNQTAEAEKQLFYLQNLIKSRSGRLDALNDPEIMADVRAAEEKTRLALEEKIKRRNLPPLSIDGRNQNIAPWPEIADALDDWRENLLPYRLFATEGNLDSTLYQMARRILLFAKESPTSATERQAKRDDILADLSIDETSEILRLAAMIESWMEQPNRSGTPLDFTASPEETARQLFHSTRLSDPQFRRQLIEGGIDDIRKSDDPLLTRAVWIEDHFAGPARKRQREIERRLATYYEKLTAARYAVFKDALYPEANFTLRLSYGTVAGYRDRNNQPISFATTIAETFAHAKNHDNAGDYSLSPKWFAHRDELNPATSINLVSTNDILGGNSGSPLLNGRGEIVGIVFDGNREGLASDFFFTDHRARAVSVDSRGIIEALLKIYKADRLLSELEWGDF